MAIANIYSYWKNGDLVFADKATKTEVFRITQGATGGAKLAQGQPIVGSQFTVYKVGILAATAAAGSTFWVAPAPCKFVKGRFNMDTAASTASYLNIEKLISTQGVGNGTNVQANSFALINTANFEQTDTASVTGSRSTLTTGDRLALKFDTTQVTLLAGGTLSCLMEWT